MGKKQRRNGKSKPGGDSLLGEDDNDYKPPTHLCRLKPKEEVVDMKMGGERRRRRRRRRRKEEEEAGALSPNMDFYYYSGFGPLWCKKRGENAENSVRIIIPPSSPSSSSSSSAVLEYHHHHDEDEGCRDEEEDVDGGDCEWEEVRKRKREKRGRGGRRKKVKARSLKTLL